MRPSCPRHAASPVSAAADRANRTHDDEHVVCVSLDPKSPRNNTKNPLKTGFVVHDPNDEIDEVTAAAAAKAELAAMKAELAKAKAEAQIAKEDAKAAQQQAAAATSKAAGDKATEAKPSKTKPAAKPKKK
jgi:hypothetical protein